MFRGTRPGFDHLLTGSQWIATGLRPRDDRHEVKGPREDKKGNDGFQNKTVVPRTFKLRQVCEFSQLNFMPSKTLPLLLGEEAKRPLHPDR